MTHFPTLPLDVRDRLDERSIDPEQSVEKFLEEVRAAPPPRLLIALGRVRYVPSRRLKSEAGW